MAARSRYDTTGCDYSERARRGAGIGGQCFCLELASGLATIDQLLLFLDNKRRSRRLPTNQGDRWRHSQRADVGIRARRACLPRF